MVGLSLMLHNKIEKKKTLQKWPIEYCLCKIPRNLLDNCATMELFHLMLQLDLKSNCYIPK
jgi:hypothetical protein